MLNKSEVSKRSMLQPLNQTTTQLPDSFSLTSFINIRDMRSGSNENYKEQLKKQKQL